MGLELIIFIIAILCGIFLYWTETKSNATYRFFNKIFNSKALQMHKNNPKGFVYKQAFIPRTLFIVSMVLVVALSIQFLTPIAIFTSYNGISAFSSFIFGMLLGTYIANFIVSSSEVIEDKTEAIGDIVDQTLDKGENFIENSKDFIEDLTTNNTSDTVLNEADTTSKENTKTTTTKTARARLKDKGLL